MRVAVDGAGNYPLVRTQENGNQAGAAASASTAPEWAQPGSGNA
jgi:hypothetical protein